jgi:biopolymer transport protein ExbD
LPRTKSHSRVRVDMTPMVDVAFLLLIFFMSTTQFKPPEQVSVALPASSSEIRVPETGTILMTVNRDNEIFISSEQSVEVERLTKDELFDAIVAWRGRNPGAVVILKGDKDADFGTVSDVMDALARAKTLRFNLMTDLKKRPPGEAGPAGAEH